MIVEILNPDSFCLGSDGSGPEQNSLLLKVTHLGLGISRVQGFTRGVGLLGTVSPYSL